MEPAVVAQQSQPATAKMSTQLLDVMFVGMCRSMPFFDETHRFLKPGYFPEPEAHYRALFHVMCTLRERHAFFNHTLLWTECHEYINNDPTICHPHLTERLLINNYYGLLFCAFTQPDVEINLTQCRDYLQRFLYERVVATPLRTFMNRVEQNATPTNLPEFLSLIQDRQREIQTVTSLPVVDTMPDARETMEAPAIYHKTGVSFIDNPLGGQREGDANGILGVTGAGKSTLAAHMGVQMAKTEYLRAYEEGRPAKLSVIFTYEEDANKLRPRIWSAAAQIRRDKLEQITNPSAELTRADNLEPYELKIAGEGADKEGEFERWQKHRTWLSDALYVADMSGSEKFPNAGSGYVDEIVSVLEGIRVLTHGRFYLSVLIDFAGLVCERYQHAKGMDDGQLRHLLKNFGDRCRREISERYSCTTWIFHQIAPSNATKSPTQPLHHSMASESRAFAEFLALCGCLGVPDAQTGCRLLNWSKTRYARTETVEPIPMRINDLFACFEDVSEAFKVDKVTRQFMTATEWDRIHGDDPEDGNGTDTRQTTAPRSRSTLSQPRARGGGSVIPPADPHTSELDVPR
jgi:hypothetical protein